MSNSTDPGIPPQPDDRQLLAELMSLAGDVAPARAVWLNTELAAVWQHQLRAPLLLDLGDLDSDANATVTLHTRQSETTLQSFADLLAHPSPPLELLQLAKEFAKRQRHSERAVFPVEIANVLYYLAIALASLRYGQRITEMDDAKLRQGLGWCLRQQWIDPATRGLLEEDLRKLKG